MGIHLMPIAAATALGAILLNHNNNDILHDTAVSLTAEALNIKESIENEFEDIIEEAERKNNKTKINVDID